MKTEWKMRESKVLRKLRSSETALCTKMNLADPRAFGIIAMSGVDCLWTCRQEHVANDYRSIQEQVLATKAHDCDLLCHVPKGYSIDYIRSLELGTTSIMVPNIMSLNDTKETVKATHFYPIRGCPLDDSNTDNKYEFKCDDIEALVDLHFDYNQPTKICFDFQNSGIFSFQMRSDNE